MRIHQISLENFRNYEKFTAEFDDSINLFLGDNAQGKTNFLEAITVLSLAKSFRTSDHSSLIGWDKDFLRIKGVATKNSDEINLEFFAGNSAADSASSRKNVKKSLKKNGISVPVKDFIGAINIVLFHPEDLNMLYLSPSLRRKYLNTLLSQIDPEYFECLVNYNRILKQRNKLLALIVDGKAKKNELSSWDVGLAENGLYVQKKRKDYVEFLNTYLIKNYKLISNIEHNIKVKYHSTIDMLEPSVENYSVILDLARDADLRYRKTEKGIHRDDLHIFFDNHHISEFASRGEIRTLLIALKLAEIEFIENFTGEKPVLLLDDVFSELDKSRQNFLLNAISGFQSFISATHLDFPLDGAKKFNISTGNITR
ncbi:DNA replication/repair protein RecF [Candidatus Peregrinibacteria bacterium]|nr:DNA replication/repair protein RecF [Candidatus Peregrinibacteria bacterium]